MIIVHGENQLVSRQYLQTKQAEAKRKGFTLVRLEGKKITPAQLTQALEGDLLFGENKLVIIENIFSGPKSHRKDELVKILKRSPSSIILWEPKKIDGRRLATFKNTEQKIFNYSPIIFSFLDSIKSKSQPQTLKLLHETLKREPIQLVFFLLVKRVKELFLICALGPKAKTKGAPWQIRKLAQQAASFTPETLLVLYQRLIQIEISQKTGRASLQLADQLDLWLMTF